MNNPFLQNLLYQEENRPRKHLATICKSLFGADFHFAICVSGRHTRSGTNKDVVLGICVRQPTSYWKLKEPQRQLTELVRPKFKDIFLMHQKWIPSDDGLCLIDHEALGLSGPRLLCTVLKGIFFLAC